MDFPDIIYRKNNYVENLHDTGNNENKNIMFIQKFYILKHRVLRTLVHWSFTINCLMCTKSIFSIISPLVSLVWGSPMWSRNKNQVTSIWVIIYYPQSKCSKTFFYKDYWQSNWIYARITFGRKKICWAHIWEVFDDLIISENKNADKYTM